MLRYGAVPEGRPCLLLLVTRLDARRWQDKTKGPEKNLRSPAISGADEQDRTANPLITKHGSHLAAITSVLNNDKI